MNKRKLNRVFEEIRLGAGMIYAVTNTDDYGDCNSCVNAALADKFGITASGIYVKHWRKGMNAGRPWAELDSVYIAHDVLSEQYDVMVRIFEENGYAIEPREYDPVRCLKITEIANLTQEEE